VLIKKGRGVYQFNKEPSSKTLTIIRLSGLLFETRGMLSFLDEQLGNKTSDNM
jgi:hypothetical protein